MGCSGDQTQAEALHEHSRNIQKQNGGPILHQGLKPRCSLSVSHTLGLSGPKRAAGQDGAQHTHMSSHLITWASQVPHPWKHMVGTQLN
jgi:hypothetical protein